MHQFKKNYGQNFLKGFKFPKKLVESLHLIKADTVIEIGPGDGILTKLLLDMEVNVIAIEIDYDLLPNLIKKYGDNPFFHLVHEDILNINLAEVLEKNQANDRIKIIGSLPYNISKKIIDDFLSFEMKNRELNDLKKVYHIDSMSFIVQEEVAKEYTSQAPKASFLSNYLRIYADIRKFQSIPADQFTPKPKVNGGILYIKLKEEIIKEHRSLARLIRLGFTSPRKTLIKNLKNSNKYSEEKLKQAFLELKLSLTIRSAEMLQDNWQKLMILIT